MRLFIGPQPSVLHTYCQKYRLEAKINTLHCGNARETPLKRKYDGAGADSCKDYNESVFAASHARVKNAT